METPYDEMETPEDMGYFTCDIHYWMASCDCD